MTRNEFTRLTDRRTILTSRTPNPVRPVRRDVRFSRDRTFGFWILCPWMESCSPGPRRAAWPARWCKNECSEIHEKRRKKTGEGEKRTRETREETEREREREREKWREKERRKKERKEKYHVYWTGNYRSLPMFRSRFHCCPFPPFTITSCHMASHGFIDPNPDTDDRYCNQYDFN